MDYGMCPSVILVVVADVVLCFLGEGCFGVSVVPPHVSSCFVIRWFLVSTEGGVPSDLVWDWSVVVGVGPVVHLTVVMGGWLCCHPPHVLRLPTTGLGGSLVTLPSTEGEYSLKASSYVVRRE